jgi:sulfite exporter TauE/SafE
MLNDVGVRYLALNALAGKLVGWLIVGAIIVLDVWALGSLKAATDVTGLAAVMMMFVAGTTLGMIQMGIAIAALSAPDQQPWIGKVLSKMTVGVKPA